MYYGPRPMQESFEVPPVLQYSLATVKIIIIIIIIIIYI
jgi:hypothetical protein